MKNINPYPSYKPSGIAWLGDIPQHWRFSKIRRLSYVYSGGTPSKEIVRYWENGTIPWLSSGEVNKRRILNANNYITDEAYNNSSAKWIPKGSIIVALAGQGKTKGKIATIEKPMTGNQSLAAIIPNSSLIDYNFLAHYLDSKYKNIRGLVGDDLRDGLNLEHIKGISIPIPPKEEQTAIAHFLDYKLHKIDRFIRKKKQLIALLNEQKAAIINDAVTKGLDPSVSMKPSGIEWLGDVPEHWKVSRMKNICTVRQGLQIPISERFFEQNSDCYEYITIKSINNPENQREYIYRPNKRVICDKDDILVVRTGGTGEIVTDVNGVFHNNFFLVDYDRNKIDKMFIFYFLKSPKIRAYLLLVAGTTTIPDLNHGEFYNTPFFEYEKSEQKAIVTHIEKETAILNRTIATIEKEIALVQEYRTTLIAEAVTGKIDVRNYELGIMNDELEEDLADEMGENTEGEDN